METIPEFFEGRSVFITGATGFIGKVLIEKILRSCSTIDSIYVLIRNRKGKSHFERLQEIFSLPLFDRVKSEKTDEIINKVISLEGDIMKKRLGLSDADYGVVCEKVSVVFHGAASIRFNDSLSYAFKMNTEGALNIVELAHNMKQLVALIHISTAYCNCDRSEIRENIYPPHADWKRTLNIVEEIDPVQLEILSQKYIGNLPNTYIFTKSLAEQVMWDQRNKLPLVIFRPSIVISSWKEPIYGWVDNLNGPTALLVGYGKGVIRTTLSDKSIVPDYMAVDVAVRAILITAWWRGQPGRSLDIVDFYNASSVKKSVTITEMIKISTKTMEEAPLYETLWHYSTHTTNNKYWFRINVWMKHVIPAFIVDTVLKILGRDPILMNIHRKVYSAMMALSYFSTRSWTFHNSNFLALNAKLLPEDREDFDFDFQNIEPQEYFRRAMLGGRKYLLHEKDELIPAAKIRMKRMKWLDQGVKGIFWFFLICVLFLFEVPQQLFLILEELLINLVNFII